MTKLVGNHTVKFGGEWRHNRDFLLQTQDAGGSRGEFQFNSSGTGSPAEPASTNNTSIANSFAAFLLDWPNVVRRDLKVDRPGHQALGDLRLRARQMAAQPERHVDLGLRWEYYTPLVGLESVGGLSNYDPITNTLNVAGYGTHRVQSRREE